MEDSQRVGVGVGVIMLKDGKILLGRRVGGIRKGSWTMPGGKMEFGEGFEEAAKREALEETGLIIRSARVICVNEERMGDLHFVTVGLLAEDFVGEPKVMEPDKIVDWGWFSLGALPAEIFEPSRNLLDCYLAKRVNKC